jgi:glycosyltransferase involved in cell wall biosynthesis
MIRGEDIIYVGNRWFGENKTSAHHIAEVLARGNRILYLEATGQRAPRGSKRDLVQILRLLGKMWRKPVSLGENFHVYAPFIIPFHRFRWVRRLNAWILTASVKRLARRIGFSRPLLWIFMPHYASLCRGLETKGIVYYITDEYSAHPNANREVIQGLEREVLAKADVVFAVSDTLLERKRAFHANCHLALHGVDLGRFSMSAARALETPPELASISGPVVGFIGFIEEWIDLELLHYAATRLPDLTFVLVGKAMQDVDRIRSLPNVRLLGHRPFTELPAYLRRMDVALLPYRLNTQVVNSNPKKLREYLAAGKPVVSVRVREVERYGPLVYIADDYPGFAAAIRRALGEDSDDRRARRAASMLEESWERRVDAVSSIVAKSIAGVHDGAPADVPVGS